MSQYPTLDLKFIHLLQGECKSVLLNIGKYSPPHFIFTPFTFIASERIQEWTKLCSLISLLTQLCMGEFEMGQNHLRVEGSK